MSRSLSRTDSTRTCGLLHSHEGDKAVARGPTGLLLQDVTPHAGSQTGEAARRVTPHVP